MRLVLAFSALMIFGSFQMESSKKSIFKGKFEKKKTYKKNGQPIEGGFDYFFKSKGNSYFVKLIDAENGISSSDIENNLGPKIKVKGFIAEGLWDTNNPEVQSRIGEYIVITELVN